jgi:uncharacterized protein YfaS (alpha-2-macroglobulin family)
MEPVEMTGPAAPRPSGPRFGERFVKVLRALGALLGRVVGRLSWTPPPWSVAAAGATRRGAERLASLLRTHRRAAVASAVAVVVLAAGGVVGYRVYQSRPRPLLIPVELTPPELTAMEATPKPHPVRITFGGSAARLDRVGKVVTQGVKLEPAMPGEWRFEDDRSLIFRPAQDWPVGQEFHVTLDRTLFPDHVRLETRELTFRTAPFEARFLRAEFYQDPVDPKLKQVVVAFAFSHPVDTADLARHVKLELKGARGGLFGLGATGQPFTLAFDKLAGEAYVRSEPIPIPDDDTAMVVTLAKGARAARGGPPTAEPISREVTVPGMFSYFRVESAHVTLVPNERLEPEQVLVLETSAGATEEEIGKHVAAWILPRNRPAQEGEPEVKNHRWSSVEIGPEILAASTRLPLARIPADRNDATLHSFKIQAPVGAFVYVRVDKGTKSFGGYVQAREWATVAPVPAFPQEVKIAQPGSLLSLAGEKKVSILARDVPGLRFEVSRVLPGQVAHLVTQSEGTFSSPDFAYRFGPDDLTERFEEKRPLQRKAPGKAQYTAFDLTRYLAQGGGHDGLFLLSVQAWDVENDRPGETTDQRFLLVTDLGLVAKQNADRSHDVFVQSVKAGTPAAGVTVEVLGRNGLPVVSGSTDAQGHVHFPALGDFKREKAPVAFLARRGEDVSFLPFDRADRRLELSRFDVGGVVTGGKGARLDAFVFSERGLYRPGDPVHVAAAVKSADWRAPLEGVPLEATITDPRGMEVQKERLALPRSGLSELSFRTEETSPTGTYAASLYLVEANGNRGALLGSTSFRVEEFLPDRMRITAHLSTERVEGWVSPKDLSARVDLQNLFGVPAEKHRVAAEFTLEPAAPRFRAFKDYVFTDPLKAKSSYSESLGDGQTDEKGEVEFALDLSRFAKATYRLGFLAQGFEADGGRGVSAAAGVLVSPLAYLVGYKTDGELRYVSRGAQRAVSLVAIGPDAAAREVKGLTAELVELRWVSVLQKKDDGTYRYESVQRELSKEKKPLSLPAGGLTYPLPTGDPGDFELRIHDGDGLELSRVPFSVAGAGNLARSLEKNAELEVKLARSDWGPGEPLELQITAPYVGAGLITIERDHVYAWKWFKTTTTSAVETIEVPPDLEGNGYVSVAFVRALDSQEIFTSPLSFGVAPFSVSRANRTIDIALSTPELARPGEAFPIRYKGSRPGKAVVFAVDEGILQVAKYKTPDPLGHFFQKRALEVSTQQILDLILPEFSIVQAVSASGGDEGQAALAHNLNPFKRKRDKPAVYWSGVVDIDEKERTLEWRVPDTFNGQVRVMAVAVSPDAVGANARGAIVRGPFVLSPNAPTFVAPGDTFEVSVAVANNVEGSGKAAKVKLEITASEHLELAGGGERTLEIGEGRESSATFQVKATGKLGSASLRFVASLGAKRSKQTVELSVRPAVAYETLILGGQLKPGGQVEAPLARHMTPEFRTLEASASPLPLCMARGLLQYLARYPHGCTEQLVSQAFPAIVLRDRPEFGFNPERVEEHLASALRTLRARQNGEGAFGMWAGNGYVSDFQTVYALHFLTEAKEHAYPVPPELLSRGLAYARGLAAERPGSLGQARVQAYALYVLTRNGVVTTRELAAFREALDAHKDWSWKTDLTAVHLAATYALLKQESQASRLIGGARLGAPQRADYDDFYDGLVYDAQLLYVLSRHFPARVRSLPADALEAIARPIADGAYNSLSSAYALLALDAYARASGVDRRSVDASLSEVLADGKARPLSVPEGLFPKVSFTAEAAKLRVKSTGDVPVFWQATLAGFEASLPTAEVKQKLEILREYQDASGKVVTQVRQGDELEVHLRVRSIGGSASNVALIDLLPGGFEPVLEQRVRSDGAGEGEESAEAERANPGDSDGASAEEGEGDGDAEATGQRASPNAGWAPSVAALPIGLDKSSWIPEYADVREDRVVIYGVVGPDLKEFVYRIKATNRGTFTVPPALGESMYDRSVKARGLPGQLKVVGRT